MRRAGLGLVLVAVLAILVLFAAGINLWTDAIWYHSVGFDSVFWTRIGAQVGLFGGILVLSLLVLLGNLLLAGRLVPPVDPERPGRLRTMAGRIAEAQRQVRRAGDAPAATTAGGHDGRDDGVTRLEVVHPRADGLDHARTLVAPDDREAPGRAEPEALVGMAQPRVVEAHLHLAGPGRIDLELDHLPVARLGEEGGRGRAPHASPSLVPACAVRPDSCSGNSSA